MLNDINVFVVNECYAHFSIFVIFKAIIQKNIALKLMEYIRDNCHYLNAQWKACHSGSCG